MGKIRGFILMRRSKYFAVADLATNDAFLTKLQEATLAAESTRIYPVFRFQAVDDQSEALVKSNTGYGDVKVVRDGNYNMIFELATGGMCLNAQLRKFNYQNGTWSALLVDDKNQILGRQDADGNLYGIDLSLFHAHPMKFNNGTDESKYMVEIGMNKPEQINDQLGIVPCNFDVETSVLGLLNVELYHIGTAAVGTVTVGARLQCGKTDLYTDLKTLLSSNALWVITDSTGAVIATTDADYNDTLKGWDIDFTGSGALTFNLAAPSVLAAAHIGEFPENGYEGVPVTITVPAT